MTNLRFLTVAVLFIGLALGAVGCGSSKTTDNKAQPTKSATAAPAKSEASSADAQKKEGGFISGAFSVVCFLAGAAGMVLVLSSSLRKSVKDFGPNSSYDKVFAVVLFAVAYGLLQYSLGGVWAFLIGGIVALMAVEAVKSRVVHYGSVAWASLMKLGN